MSSIDPPVVFDMDGRLHQKLQNALPKAQYNPFKYWMIGRPDEAGRKKFQVLSIKVSDTECLVACPEKHLVATGADFLETQSEFQRALLKKLDLPRDTMVSVTCAPPFDLDGNTLKPRPNAPSEPVAEPTNPPAAPAPTDQAPAAPEGQGMFDSVTDTLDLTADEEPDPNEELQGSLFL